MDKVNWFADLLLAGYWLSWYWLIAVCFVVGGMVLWGYLGLMVGFYWVINGIGEGYWLIGLKWVYIGLYEVCAKLVSLWVVSTWIGMSSFTRLFKIRKDLFGDVIKII